MDVEVPVVIGSAALIRLLDHVGVAYNDRKLSVQGQIKKKNDVTTSTGCITG